tara:strand:- start:667 stop:1188 length:522 start_codon:yes stop_codon:yes gene_type:complete
MKRLVLIIFFYLNILNLSVFASDKIVYIDVDFIMSNSKVGKYVSKKIEEVHKKNINSFKKIEDDLKEEEAKIVKKRSVLSKEDFQKEISKLREKANDYRVLRKEKIDKITKQRLSATAKIIKELRPILAEYSDKNSISIIVEKKNIIIGKSELDVTKDILILLDEQIKKISLE